jgi:hypothetical protein
MALDILINSPLTESQAELTAKIGSMKSLLALPFNRKINIPKEKQISTFDYLLKVLKAVGIAPESIFLLFISKVFDTSTTFLEDKVLGAFAASLAQNGRDLTSGVSTPVSPLNATVISQLQAKNLTVLKNAIPASFLSTVKQQIAKDLTIMIFGPQDGAAAQILNPSPTERARLITDAVCGSNTFSLSSPPIVRDEDIEFNRIALQQQLTSGNVIMEISCQQVKITLPANPGIIFNGGGINTITNSVVSPAQSLSLLINHVNNQVQSINNEANANSGGKNFSQILIEKLLSFITTLVFPYVGAVFSFLNTQPAANGLNPSDYIPSTCDLVNNPTSVTKKAFASSIMNELFKALLKLLLITAIREFKKLVANYFARTATEKLRRKSEKIKMKFAIFQGVSDLSDKIQKYTAAISSLNTIIQSV